AVNLLSRTLVNQQLVSHEGAAVAQVISDYARSWSLLQGYDEQSLGEQPSKQQGMQSLDFDQAFAAITELKHKLISKGEATELFGQLRGDGLASALATIEQRSEERRVGKEWRRRREREQRREKGGDRREVGEGRACV